MNNPKKKSSTDENAMVWDSLKTISISRPDANKDPIYPIKRKMRFINLDKSINTLISRGWKSLGKEGIPHTTDTVMFKKKSIIPVEIKWRNKEKKANKKAIEDTIDSFAKKLLTFVTNVYQLDKKKVTEYWLVTSFLETDSIAKGVKKSTLGLIENYSWIEDKISIEKIINQISVKQITVEEIETMKLDGYNKSPKWFVDNYEKISVAKPNEKTAKAPKAKAEPKKSPKSKNPKVSEGKTVQEPKAKNDKELKVNKGEFESYKQQQAAFQGKLIKAINALTKEVIELRKSKKK